MTEHTTIEDIERERQQAVSKIEEIDRALKDETARFNRLIREAETEREQRKKAYVEAVREENDLNQRKAGTVSRLMIDREKAINWLRTQAPPCLIEFEQELRVEFLRLNGITFAVSSVQFSANARKNRLGEILLDVGKQRESGISESEALTYIQKQRKTIPVLNNG